MIARERDDLLRAFSDCLPASAGGVTALRRAAEGLGRLEGARWELAVPGGELDAAGLRLIGTGGYSDWLAGVRTASGAAARLCEGWSAPPAGRPWAAVSSSFASPGAALTLFGRDRRGLVAVDCSSRPVVRRLQARPFDAGFLGDPDIERALSDFSRLVAVSQLVVEAGGAAWAVRFREAPAWPELLRCDVAASFAAQAGLLTLLLLSRSVRELEFREGRLWAMVAG